RRVAGPPGDRQRGSAPGFGILRLAPVPGERMAVLSGSLCRRPPDPPRGGRPAVRLPQKQDVLPPCRLRLPARPRNRGRTLERSPGLPRLAGDPVSREIPRVVRLRRGPPDGSRVRRRGGLGQGAPPRRRMALLRGRRSHRRRGAAGPLDAAPGETDSESATSL